MLVKSTCVFPGAIFKLWRFNHNGTVLYSIWFGLNHSVESGIGTDDKTVVARVEHEVSASDQNFSGSRNNAK